MNTDSHNAEFRRQLRSLFAVLRAIVRRSSIDDHSRAEFAALLEGRIGALARVHDMLMRAPNDGVDLAELVHGEMLAQTIPSSRYRARGPDTRIAREAATPIALALHELAVNALVHGAFAADAGFVEVTWAHLDRNGVSSLNLVWQESGVNAKSEPPTVKGFGLELLERTLPYELGATTSIGWLVSGARVEIHLPAAARVPFWRPSERPLVAHR